MKIPSTTKQGQPNMFFTMVILEACSILYTYSCSAPSLMPGGQKWGSKMFSPALKLPFLPQQRWEKFGVVCWHSTSPHTTTVTNHLQPRKRVWTKLWLPTPSTLITTDMTPASKSAVPGTTALSEDGSIIELILNENKADAFVAKIQAKPGSPSMPPQVLTPLAPRIATEKGTL
jgi:hypothetical protein